MTVVFDAEPLVAFAFDEPGAETVEQWLNRVYDGDVDGYVTTVNLAEIRYIATRKSSETRADAYIGDLKRMGVTEYEIDDLWENVASLKVTHNPSLGDTYAVAAAVRAAEQEDDVTLLVGPDDDFDPIETDDGFEPTVERFREESV